MSPFELSLNSRVGSRNNESSWLELLLRESLAKLLKVCRQNKNAIEATNNAADDAFMLHRPDFCNSSLVLINQVALEA